MSFVGFSQKDIVGTGGDGTSTAGTFSYSVGQLIVNQVSAGSNLSDNEAITLTHGVQQYFLPNCLTNTNTAIIASPNPTRGLVNINLTNWDKVDVSLSITDASGRSVMNKILNSKKSTLELSYLSSGLYILNIRNTCGAFTSFKLIISKK